MTNHEKGIKYQLSHLSELLMDSCMDHKFYERCYNKDYVVKGKVDTIFPNLIIWIKIRYQDSHILHSHPIVKEVKHIQEVFEVQIETL